MTIDGFRYYSEAIGLYSALYEKLYGEKMMVRATHGGLECAIMGAKYPNWEMVSIGPTIRYPHSPDEKLEIASVARTWEYLKAVLENAPKR